MNIAFLVKYLHVICMFLAVGFAVGPGMVLHRIAEGEDVRTIRNVFRLARPVVILGPVFFGIGLIFGLVAIVVEGFSFLAPWLVSAYVIFAVATILGGVVDGPWMGKVGRAAAASPEVKASEELRALAHDRTSQYSARVGLIAIILIVFVMVVKPLG
jgi:Predicted integral membrane protein (DUF2269)